MHTACLLTFTILAVHMAGCGSRGGPTRVAVEGKVTFCGEPLEAGSILFLPTGGTSGPEAGGAIRNGEFHLPQRRGPVVGTLRVEIRADQTPGFDFSEPGETVPHIGEPWPKNPIPAVYNDQSTLVVETTAEGDNQFDFTLDQSAAGR